MLENSILRLLTSGIYNTGLLFDEDPTLLSEACTFACNDNDSY